MIVNLLLLLFVASSYEAAKVPGCNDRDNVGVFKEFGPLPSKLYDSNLYIQVYLSGMPFTTFESKPFLKNYVFEYTKFKEGRGVGSAVYSYYRVLYKDKGKFSALDYVRVYPEKWDTLEQAILSADETPSGDRILKMKFLLSDCTCVVRNYDLNNNDVVAMAKSTPCDDLENENPKSYPHSLRPSFSKDLQASKEISMMRANDKFTPCDLLDNVGVMYEFGPIPTALRDPQLYRLVHRADYTSYTLALTDQLDRYKVEFHEYTPLYGTGNDVHGYLTLYYWDPVSYTYKVLDYLRVDIFRWRQIRQAILEADHKDINRILRVKFFTSDCRCVQRLYDLRSLDIPADATTLACNGDPIATPVHRISSGAKLTTTIPDVTRFGLKDKYPGCDVTDNVGVLDVFGPLPTNLMNIHFFNEVINREYYNTKYKLWHPQENYVVTYSEFKSQGASARIYSFLTLHYHEDGVLKVIDYLRVHPEKWNDIQVAMLEADTRPDSFRRLNVRWLTADCGCTMRVYDLTAANIARDAVTKSCDGLTVVRPQLPGTVADEQQALALAEKVNFAKWTQMPAKRA